MSAPGELIGRGRRAEVYDLGGGRVLRRYREGPGAVDLEAEVMTHARAHGVPVPEVFDTGGDTDLVMESVSGPTMLDDLARRPWKIVEHARELARLQRVVHAVPALQGLRAPFGPGASLLHLDLHPMNVLLGASGPVIIDWEGAANGPPEADIALAWLLIRFSEIPGSFHQRVVGAVGQSSFASLFRYSAGGISLEWVLKVAEFRLLDPTVTPRESTRLRKRVAGRGEP